MPAAELSLCLPAALAHQLYNVYSLSRHNNRFLNLVPWCWRLLLLMLMVTSCESFKEDTRPAGASKELLLQHDTYVTTANKAIIIRPLANDAIFAATRFTMGTPAVGQLVHLAADSFQYRPAVNYIGADSISYQLQDDRGTHQGMVRIWINRGQDSCQLVTVPDLVETVAFSTISFNPVLNDVNCDPVGLHSFEQPRNGQLVLSQRNTLRYTPRPGFVGTDTAIYYISNLRGNTHRGQITFQVAPNASCDAAFLPKDDTVYFDFGSVSQIIIPKAQLTANDSSCVGDININSLTLLNHPASGFMVEEQNRLIYYIQGTTTIQVFRYRVQNLSGTRARNATVYLMPR